MARFSVWRKVCVIFLLGLIFGAATGCSGTVKGIGQLIQGVGTDFENGGVWLEERWDNGYRAERDSNLDYVTTTGR